MDPSAKEVPTTLPEDFPVNHNLDDLVTPLNIPVLMEWLDKYSQAMPDLDREITIMRDGFKDGFVLFSNEDIKPWTFKNHKSARVLPDEVWKILRKEVSSGRIAGPFDHEPIKNLRIHPIGLVGKPEGRWRYIYDHSMKSDDGLSVNNCVPENCRKVKYLEFEKVIDRIVEIGVGCRLFKTDIRSAFRLLPLKKSQYRLTGIFFGNHWFIDKTLVMGASSSCFLFESFSNFLNWIIIEITGDPDLYHFLDDYIGLDEPSEPNPDEKSENHLCLVQSVAGELGVPFHPDKTEGPTTRLTFLGMGLDTQLMIVYAPIDKVIRASAAINIILHNGRVKVRLVASALGLCAFLCRAIGPAGRAFLQRSYRAIASKDMNQYILLGPECRLDLLQWRTFLYSYNGQTMMPIDDGQQGQSFGLWTDSSTSWGCSAYLQSANEYFAVKWPDQVSNKLKSTCLAELVPIVYSFFVPTWSQKFYDHKVAVYCDNTSTVAIINKMTSKVPYISEWLRPLALRLMHLNVRLTAIYVNTKDQIADAPSRGLFDKFYSQVGSRPSHVTPIISGLPELSSLQVSDH